LINKNELFYKDGIVEIDFVDDKLDKILFDIFEGKVNPGFELRTKYAKTYDLRPDVISYDDVFLDALVKNKSHELIREYTLRNMALSHVQIRIVEDDQSYMNWHRDTYYKNDGTLVGQAPHGVKIIYYPSFNEETEDRLLYLLGSNRVLFPTSAFDNQLFNILKVQKISAKKGKAILFDTNGLHAVVPEAKSKRSIRLIYNFLEAEQIKNISKEENNIHLRTMKAYENLFKTQ
jgi:ectoine hydroxylase-related dioxygenase (phytanoyl-CoA dioxygenase family)